MIFHSSTPHGIDPNTIQDLYKFSNGYGASVLRGGSIPYGEIELAVMHEESDGMQICYDTWITDDVIGHLTEDEVSLLLEEIRKLPPEV